MENKEFCLSSKIMREFEDVDDCDSIRVIHVKEFIKELKKGISPMLSNCDWGEDDIMEVIDKLAGKDLI